MGTTFLYKSVLRSSLFVVQLRDSRCTKIVTYISKVPHEMGRKAMAFKRTSIPFTEQQLLNIFQSHDVDGDGKLSRDELKNAFKYLGSRWDAYRTDQALRQADANDDGYITEDELKKLV